MVQKLRSDFKEEMENTLKKKHDTHPPPTLPTLPAPIIPPQPLLAPPGVPQPSNTPRSHVPHRHSHSPTYHRDHRREDKRPVSTHRSPPRRRARSTHSMQSHRQPSHSPQEQSLRLYAPGREHLHHLDDTTNERAGPLVSLTVGTHPIATTTHSSIKSVSMRHSPLPSQSPSQLIPLNNPLTILNIIPKAKRSHLALPISLRTLRSQASPKRRNHTVLAMKLHFYLTTSDLSHEEWISQVKFALNHKSKIQAACELPEDQRPRPLETVNKALLESAALTLANLASDIPSHKIKLVTHVLAGAGLLDSVNLHPAKVLHLPTTKKGALVIPMPTLEKFKPRPLFGGKTNRTWALIHGTSVTDAQRILLEGFIRPADWTFNSDLKQSHLPTFGAYALGTEVARPDTQCPNGRPWT